MSAGGEWSDQMGPLHASNSSAPEEWFASGNGSGLDGPEGHPDQAFCPCGNAWFEGGLVAYDWHPETGWGINGVHGFLRCSECGEPFIVPTEAPR